MPQIYALKLLPVALSVLNRPLGSFSVSFLTSGPWGMRYVVRGDHEVILTQLWRGQDDGETQGSL